MRTLGVEKCVGLNGVHMINPTELTCGNCPFRKYFDENGMQGYEINCNPESRKDILKERVLEVLP